MLNDRRVSQKDHSLVSTVCWLYIQWISVDCTIPMVCLKIKNLKKKKWQVEMENGDSPDGTGCHGVYSFSDPDFEHQRWTFPYFSSLMSKNHRIGWWENLQDTPIFDGKNHGFRLRFSRLNQSMEKKPLWCHYCSHCSHVGEGMMGIIRIRLVLVD